MDSKQVLDNFTQKLTSAKDQLGEEFNSLRTGRANAAMLDTVSVEVYGSSMPLKQVAGISTVGADLIQISPFDPNTIAEIAQAIRSNAALGFNPTDDGHVIRVPVPPLSEERRREIAKQISEKVEECYVKMRNYRHEAISSIDKLKKDKSIGEDEAKRLDKQIEDQMNNLKKMVEEIAKSKETEILSI
jgi:ribosome recycling factor